MKRRNPSTMAAVGIGVAAGLGGLLVGYMLAGSSGTSAKSVWYYWVIEDEGLTSYRFRPYIKSPTGQTLELTAHITRVGAEDAAKKAIVEQGGTPVQGQLV